MQILPTSSSRRLAKPSSRLFRIFLSSTFSDFGEEREALRARVFAPMAELVARRGFALQLVDLRWGVADEAALEHDTLRICLEQIQLSQERSPRPNFVILLGERYGWRPLPVEISSADLDRLRDVASQSERALLEHWYKLDANGVPPIWRLRSRKEGHLDGSAWEAHEATLRELLSRGFEVPRRHPRSNSTPGVLASATEREIELGLLSAVGAAGHVFAIRRTIDDLQQLVERGAGPQLARYIDWQSRGQCWDQSAWRRQRELRQRVAEHQAAAGASDRLFDCSSRLEGAGLSRAYLESGAALPAPEQAIATATPPATLVETVWRGLWQVLRPKWMLASSRSYGGEASRELSTPAGLRGARPRVSLARRRSRPSRGGSKEQTA